MGTRQIFSYIFSVVVILLVIGIEDATARGARGGGARFSGSRSSFRSGYRSSSSYRSSSYRSSYRSSSYRSGYRSSSYRPSSYRSSYGRYRTSRGIDWKVAVVAGTIIGSRRYSTRRRYYNDNAPEICKNYAKDTNGSAQGLFFCPLDGLGDEYEYCCGEEGSQECCTFFDSPGRTAGVVIGILLAFGLIGLIIFCCCKHSKKSKPKHTNHAMHSIAKTTPANSYPKSTYPVDGYPQPDTNGYPAAAPASAMPGSYPSVPPPSYDSSNNLPYNPNPTGYPPHNLAYPAAAYVPQPSEAYTPPPVGSYSPYPTQQGLPYSPAPVGFVDPSLPGAADGMNPYPAPDNPAGFSDLSGGNKYSNPNVPGQGYSAPSAPPPYSS